MQTTRFFAFALVLFCTPAFAQEPSPDAATKSILASCDSLVTQAKYLSAYKLLAAVEDPNDLIIAREIEICVRYFAQSFGHRMFALVDLKPGESLDSLRRSGGTFEGVTLDPEVAVKGYLLKYPKSGILLKELGDYYYDVLLRYQGRWFESDAEVVKRATDNYEAAFAMGSLDANSLGAYAEMLIRQGEFAKTIPVLDKAIALDPSNGNSHYNLAYACIQNRDFARAISEAKVSIDLYENNPAYLFDSYILASDASKASGDLSGAFDLLAMAAKVKPGDYRILRKRIPLDLLKDDTATARKDADALFAMGPRNPSSPQMIMDGYYYASKKKELAAFFEGALQNYQGDDEALGNILFHYSLLAHDTGDNAKARALLNKAEAAFKNVLSADNQVYKAIESQRRAYGG